VRAAGGELEISLMNPPQIPTPRRVLCAIASTSEAESMGLTIAAADRHAAQMALDFAAKVGAAVRFVHVVDFLDARGHASVPLVQQLVRDELTPELAALEAKAGEMGVEASHVFTRGKAWYKLLREAHRWSADLVVLSPRRDKLSFGDRVLHGSTASRVLRKAQCPVWIVDPRSRGETLRVLALVGRTVVSEQVVSAANMLADGLGAERYALHCLDYPNDIALVRMPDARQAIRAYHDEILGEAREDLRRLTGGKEAGWNLLFENDWVVRKAPSVVEEHEIDVVVLGSLSNRSLAGVLLGTTAGKLLERCQVSAYIVRPDDWVSPIQFDS
jgi:nucleotide-binding universal stress UspA family protein